MDVDVKMMLGSLDFVQEEAWCTRNKNLIKHADVECFGVFR